MDDEAQAYGSGNIKAKSPGIHSISLTEEAMETQEQSPAVETLHEGGR
jgi:hypothetical protein